MTLKNPPREIDYHDALRTVLSLAKAAVAVDKQLDTIAIRLALRDMQHYYDKTSNITMLLTMRD